MARTWLSIRVELVSGRSVDYWPRPGRILAAARSHSFRQLADAINHRVRPLGPGAHARWSWGSPGSIVRIGVAAALFVLRLFDIFLPPAQVLLAVAGGLAEGSQEVGVVVGCRRARRLAEAAQ